ncbi:MAG: hypothetical protein BGO55_08185 [Sphingobacteriales bacterium 50-39]|nr:hypothetical protein [Sphingobacteriales bacterium]OJW53214.1 MAG: hypothetical protein BGO55_08185 [Sphingobacteriales bacterium 50-39]
MQYKIRQAITGGFLATIVMTVMMVMIGAWGLPKISPPAMLSAMMGFPLALGWISHFMIGMIFAAGYVFFLDHWLHRIHSRILKGTIFGTAVFMIAQIAIPVLNAALGTSNTPGQEGSFFLLVTGSLIGHIAYGITVALAVKAGRHATSGHPMA